MCVRLAGLLLLSALALAPWGTPSHAVIIATGDGTGNKTPPPDDPGFANVGAMSGTAVYLGIWRVEDAYMAIGVTVRVSPTVFAGAMVLPLLLGLLGGCIPAIAVSRLPITDTIRSAG